jgi:hypothetical protein
MRGTKLADSSLAKNKSLLTLVLESSELLSWIAALVAIFSLFDVCWTITAMSICVTRLLYVGLQSPSWKSSRNHPLNRPPSMSHLLGLAILASLIIWDVLLVAMQVIPTSPFDLWVIYTGKGFSNPTDVMFQPENGAAAV